MKGQTDSWWRFYFFLNASLTCKHGVKVMVSLASVVLFVCVWSAGMKGEGGKALVRRLRRTGCVWCWLWGLGHSQWSNLHKQSVHDASASSWTALSSQCCCLGRRCEAATCSHICCLGCRRFRLSLASFGLVLSCSRCGSYSLHDSLFVRLYTIVAFPCFVLQCAEMALKELLNPLSPPFRLFSLPILVPYISLLPLFCPWSPLALSLLCSLSSLHPPKSPLSAPAMKWQLRGCQCGFSTLLILFQRDLEIQHEPQLSCSPALTLHRLGVNGRERNRRREREGALLYSIRGHTRL